MGSQSEPNARHSGSRTSLAVVLAITSACSASGAEDSGEKYAGGLRGDYAVWSIPFPSYGRHDSELANRYGIQDPHPDDDELYVLPEECFYATESAHRENSGEAAEHSELLTPGPITRLQYVAYAAARAGEDYPLDTSLGQNEGERTKAFIQADLRFGHADEETGLAVEGSRGDLIHRWDISNEERLQYFAPAWGRFGDVPACPTVEDALAIARSGSDVRFHQLGAEVEQQTFVACNKEALLTELLAAHRAEDEGEISKTERTQAATQAVNTHCTTDKRLLSRGGYNLACLRSRLINCFRNPPDFVSVFSCTVEDQPQAACSAYDYN